MSSKARAEEQKLKGVIEEYNDLVESSHRLLAAGQQQHQQQHQQANLFALRQPADLQAILEVTRKPADFSIASVPFPWLDRAATGQGMFIRGAVLRNELKVVPLLAEGNRC
jgi:hypothetical protein